MLRVSEKEHLVIAEFKLFLLLVIRMVNLLNYIEEKNGTFESSRYSRALVIVKFHCIRCYINFIVNVFYNFSSFFFCEICSSAM